MSDTQVVLTEWQSRTVALPREVAHELLAKHSKHVQVTPTEDPTKWVLRPTSIVGAFAVADHRFVIRTKVPLPSLLALMDVPPKSELIMGDTPVDLDAVADLQLAIVRLFCAAVEATTQRGIRRDYVQRAERLLAPRGRIDVREVIRRPGMDSPVPCVHDDHAANTPLNRLVKAALVRCGRMPAVSPIWRRRLSMQRHEFEDVDHVGDLEWASRWEPSPMERHYRTTVALARWILEGGSAGDRHGSSPVSGFLLDMNKLFEDFVTREIGRALEGRFVVTGQDQLSLGQDGSVTMFPDIAVKDSGRAIAVADTKYKVLDDQLARIQDYYQVLAYATAYGLKDAWLIYAKSPTDRPLRDVLVRNTETTLRTHALDLSRPVEDLRQQIAAFADRMVVQSRVMHPA